MATGNVTVRLNLNSTGYSAGISAAQRQMRAMQSATAAMGHSTVSSMQASSAAIRVLEGGMTGNIRAAERFISLIPGIGKALQAVFPLVGGIALAGVFVKIGEEAAKAIKEIQQMPQAITNGFRELNQAGLTANDTLQLTNDRLRNEIAKLEGKPQNNLAIAIDEARLAADKLATSLDRDNQKIAEMVSQHHIGGLKALFTNRTSTSDVEGSMQSYTQQLSDLGNQRNIAVHSGDQAQADLLSKAISDKIQSAIAWSQRSIYAANRDNVGHGAPNQGAVLSDLYGFQSNMVNVRDAIPKDQDNAQLEALKAKLERAKELAEAQKQAQELIVQGWHKAFDENKADNDMTLAQEAQFWNQRVMESKKGSLSYVDALDEVNKIISQMRGQNMRGGKEFDATSALSYLPGNMDLGKGDTSSMQQSGRAASEYLKTLNQGIALQHANADAIAEASLQMEVATGRISRLGAAQAQAALHAQEYRDAISAIDQAVANAQNLPEGFDKQSTIAGLNNQRSQATASYQIQSGQDQQAIASQQLGSGTQNTLRVMMQNWSNMTAAIEQAMTTAADSFNDDIAKAITGNGKKGDFGKTFTNLGESLTKTALQKGESALLGALGLGGLGGGKPDGTSGNPIYTKDAGTVGGAGGIGSLVGGGNDGGGFLGGIFSKLFGGGGAGAADGLGSTLSGAAGGLGDAFSSFAGFFASGGDVLANHPAIVGEQGPELFMPRSAGTIIPNHQLGGGGGDGNHFHFNITSNDPEAVRAAVMRAAPHIIAASVQAQHSSAKRSPRAR
jgi:hypothetical protein